MARLECEIGGNVICSEISSIEELQRAQEEGFTICFDCHSESADRLMADRAITQEVGENEFFEREGISFAEAKARAKRKGRRR